MTLISRLWEKLRNKKYREEFVAAQARRAIPFQIRALMRAKGISQQQLAERSGLTQGVISRAANPAYGKMTLNTVIRVAAGLDVAFIGVFVPFSRLTDFFDRMDETTLGDVATFTEEDERITSGNVAGIATSNRASFMLLPPTGIDARIAEVSRPRMVKATLNTGASLDGEMRTAYGQ